MHLPCATYRIQFNKAFGFQAARQIIPYLSELGISDLYASPIFEARKGSNHGYDIVNPLQLNPELGEEKDFEELIETLKGSGLHWLQDIVPNHMAFDSENAMLMDVLENGENSPYFHFFDIDWNYPYENIRGRLLTPFLGKFYAESLESGEIQLQYSEAGFSINYYNLKLPLKIESYARVLEHNLGALEERLGSNDSDFTKFLGALHFLKTINPKTEPSAQFNQTSYVKKNLWNLYTSNNKIQQFINENIAFLNGTTGNPQSFDALDRLISEQFFRLSFWKVATEEINYRRFFTINELISLRVEDEAVFNFTHDMIFRLVNEGKFNGLRVDHIDGLYDPTTYLKRLRQKTKDTYIVVEKILAPEEQLPSVWPVNGTTGYDFMNYVNGVFCQKANERNFSKIYYKFTGLHTSYADLVWEKKRLIIGKHLAGNIDNLAQLMKNISYKDKYGRDITLYGLRRALVEIIASYPVYRTYISHEIYSETDLLYIKNAIQKARERAPELLYELNYVEKFLLLLHDEALPEAEKEQWIHFVMSFQQYTAPIMAKGFEDTILYIYNKLISLNEVGSSPNIFGFSRKEFHEFNGKRCTLSPQSLAATSTHDSKRGEDVRARINVLSEIPEEWKYHLKTWRKINRSKKKKVKDTYMPDENDEYFLYQTLLGAFPFDENELETFIERIKSYMIKAVREAKVHTAWIKPDTDYENACISFIEKILSPPEDNKFLKEFLPFQRKIAHYGILNSLSQTLLKLTCPGIPDFYQGTELWDLNLVDPDNRRPIDYQQRAAALHDIKEKAQQDTPKLIDELASNKEDGRIKLFLTYRLLQARKERIRTFQNGSYMPLDVQGTFKDHIIAFARRHENDWAISIAPRFFTPLTKEDQFPVGEHVWTDTHIIMPDGTPPSWHDAITGLTINCTDKLSVGHALTSFPVSLLINAHQAP